MEIWMKYSLTIFNNLYDVSTEKRMDCSSWEKFEQLLRGLANKPGFKPKKGEYVPRDQHVSPLISPAIYKPGTTRANENVIEWASWAAVDVDEHKFKGELKDELFNLYGHHNYTCYSTASSTDVHPKFRLVFPLRNAIPSDKIRHFWFSLNSELDSIGDKQTKDLSRMYFVPAVYPNANNFFFTNRLGMDIDPYDLMAKHPFVEKKTLSSLQRMPKAIQEAIIKERANKLTNTDYRWSHYTNCPFVSKKMITEYQTITGTGWYHKMYQMMVGIASSAVKRGYPMTAKEIAVLCRQIDDDTGRWYAKRPLEKEADRALEYVLRNMI